MDPHSWTLIKSVQMPSNGADHMDFGPPGTTCLLVSCEYDGQSIKVDWRKMRVLRTLNVGGMPIDVKLAEPHRRRDHAVRRLDVVRLREHSLVRAVDRPAGRALPLRAAHDDRVARSD